MTAKRGNFIDNDRNIDDSPKEDGQKVKGEEGEMEGGEGGGGRWRKVKGGGGTWGRWREVEGGGRVIHVMALPS